MASSSPLFLVLILPFFTGTNAAVFTLQNRCNRTIWPGMISGAGRPQLTNGGLELKPNQKTEVRAPTGWSGRFWARTGCVFDQSGQHGNCTTGDCGGLLACSGSSGAPPASLAEFTLDSPEDFYDVSLVDGFNIPVSIVPSGGSGNCSAVNCTSDLNQNCPKELQVRLKDNGGGNGAVVGCKSACMAFKESRYCCTGVYNSPQVCKPTNYSEIFKRACPTSYSYPYDDATSTFTCKGANYLILFC